MQGKKIEAKIELPKGVEAKVDKGIVSVKGPKGESKRSMIDPWISIKMEGNALVLSAKRQTKREKTKLWTFASHFENMVKGATQGYKYLLKVCSGHFPMSVSVSGNELIVKNFLGEKKPRAVKIKSGASVKVDGDKIIVESIDKEIAGQTAADIEAITRVTNRDLRVFQDGIYITEKDGEPIR